ncbi:MAG TPA: 3-oxoacyl-[acyl-carrier-protein] synthase III C-terminal domain-containing protein [Acidobacteriota bacterium]|jgi:alkylresorcinol/alkylpyrone synthase|nr:3-oxoacyl-[acyl-carrier-protein] synthase III C-terminal domain-containing protein [Acidobacteriota bacterium]
MHSSNGAPAPRIAALATAVPSFRMPQAKVKEICRSYFQLIPRIEMLLNIFDNAEVEFRHFCFPPEYYLSPRAFQHRNQDFLEHAMLLSDQAIAAALNGSSLESIDHIIYVTTTGVITPSLEAYLYNRLKLRPDVRRTPIFGIGCAGGVNALAHARDFALAYPDSRTLILAVELCGQTFQKGDFSAKNLVAVSLFGDGVSAVVVDGKQGETEGPQILGTYSELIRDSLDVMGWDVTSNGLELILSPTVDDYVHDCLPGITDRFLQQQEVELADIDYFIFHPGGPKILRAYQEAFQLGDEELRFSRHILRCYGNTSSASVLFVLKDVLDHGHPPPGAMGLVAAMGPGFAAELALVRF